MNEFQQAGFFVEPCGDVDRQSPNQGQLPWLPLLAGVSRLWMRDESPRLEPLSVSSDDEATEVRRRVSSGTTRGPLLEVVTQGFESFIAVMADRSLKARINGMPAGPVSILQVKDQLQVDGNYLLHVSRRHTPHAGPAGAAEVGCECPVCRTPIVDGQTVFRCTSCGAPIHQGAPDRDEHDRLQCAAASSVCCRCQRPLFRKEGYEYVPDA